MPIFTAIITFFESIFGSSQFADAAHALFSSMGASNDIAVYDSAVQTAAKLLAEGATMAGTIEQVRAAHSIPEHHAAVVVAAAKAQIDKASAPKATA